MEKALPFGIRSFEYFDNFAEIWLSPIGLKQKALHFSVPDLVHLIFLISEAATGSYHIVSAEGTALDIS